ncbi:hypothetical protein QR680_009860 [Steinernema hermaphroditum]|uniref:Uncharacterized protein n=1 Tax=Steinernema hermaphroditum TaxID=289476 RepID=A0AA39MAN5_9BILA|nr:hypothetical protein QR680_009860 [Steinernema hermaphroditum]
MVSAEVLSIPYVILPGVIIPLYLLICYVLRAKEDFYKKPVYLIFLHICYVNGILMFTMLTAGLFELTERRFEISPNIRPIEITMGALSFWYRSIYTFLSMLLAVNRLLWVFDAYRTRTSNYEVDIYRYCFFLMWFALLVLTLMSNYLNLPFKYEMKQDIYVFKDASHGTQADFYIMLGFMTVAILCHLITTVRLLHLKFLRRSAIDRSEFNIFARILILFAPIVFGRVLRFVINHYLKDYGIFLLIFAFVYRMVPVVNLCSLLYMDGNLRKEVLQKAKRIFHKITIKRGSFIKGQQLAMRVIAIVTGVFYALDFFVFIVPYGYVLWILQRWRQFNNNWSYRIMTHICAVNVVQLGITLPAAVFEFSRTSFSVKLTETLGAIGYWYRPSYAIFLALLAFNRFLRVFRFWPKYEVHFYWTVIVQYSSLLVVIFTVLSGRVDLSFTYCFETNIYYSLNESVVDVEFYCTLSALAVTLFLYATILTRLYYNKYISNLKLSRLEAVILVQAVLAFLPLAILRCTRYFQISRDYIDGNLYATFAYNILYRSLPAINFATLLMCNSALQGILRERLFFGLFKAKQLKQVFYVSPLIHQPISSTSHC